MWQSNVPHHSFPQSSRRALSSKQPSRHRTSDKLVLSEYKPQTLIIKDHDNEDVILTWCSKCYDEDPVEKVPPFPFQVYLTNAAKEAIKDVKGFAERFICFIEWIGGVPHHSGHCAEDRCSQRQCRHEAGFHEDEYGSRNFKDYASTSFCHYRFEIYTKPLTNILACVAHQRREILYRNRNGVSPQMVHSWTTLPSGYKGRIIVIDRDDWMDAGVVLVGFHPDQYERGHNYTFWKVAQKGDHPVVEAGHVGAKSILRERLRAWWVSAGHSWTEAHLDRRNKGAVTPVLYPAIDPAAHRDAEHEEIHELDGTSLQSPVVEPVLVHPDTGDVLIEDTFDKAELFLKDNDLRHLRCESYSDSFGLPVTSVWNAKVSNLRPVFSMTIYLTFDVVIYSKALFNCLDKGFITKEPWTLDIVRNMPNLEASFDYHARASSLRTSERTLRRRSCTEMLLHKIAGHKLPTELCDYIRDLIVPPEIPNYSARPTRLFKDVFMFLDATSLSTGPRLVYSNPTCFWQSSGETKGPFDEPGRWSSAFMREYASQAPTLQVINLRYWHRVADEIHILWSFSSPRLTSVDPTSMPRIKLRMNMPENVHRGQFAGALAKSELRYELHFSEPITLPIPSLSHWGLFDIIDLETGMTLPRLPFRLRGINSCSDSWEQSRELGFNRPRFLTLWPSSLHRKLPAPVTGGSQGWCEPYLHAEGLLTHGHRYELRLREGVHIPRWILGTSRGGGHPYNLPPIEVTMSESAQLTFRYLADK